MNIKFMNTAKRLQENEISIKDLPHITLDMLEEAEGIISDAKEHDIFRDLRKDSFEGIILIKITDDKVVDVKSSEPVFLTDKDKEKIVKFVDYDKIDTYFDRYFRIDLERYILLFSINKKDDSIILLGNILQNKREIKLELSMLKQSYLMREFI